MMYIVFTCGLAVFVAIGVSTYTNVYQLEKDINSEALTLSRVIADANTAALAFNDNKQAFLNLHNLQSNPSVASACLYDNKANLFADFVRDFRGQNGCASKLPNTASAIDGTQVFLPVIEKSVTIGHLVMTIENSRLTRFVDRQIRIALYVSMLVIVLILLPLAWNFQKVLSAPILRLLRITQTCELVPANDKSPVSAMDELAQLQYIVTHLVQHHKQLQQAIGIAYDNNASYLQFLDLQASKLSLESKMNFELIRYGVYGAVANPYHELAAEVQCAAEEFQDSLQEMKKLAESLKFKTTYSPSYLLFDYLGTTHPFETFKNVIQAALSKSDILGTATISVPPNEFWPLNNQPSARSMRVWSILFSAVFDLFETFALEICHYTISIGTLDISRDEDVIISLTALQLDDDSAFAYDVTADLQSKTEISLLKVKASAAALFFRIETLCYPDKVEIILKKMAYV